MYLKVALKKPVYLHDVILDPRIKMFFFSKHAEHFAQYGIHTRMIRENFAVAANRYSTHAAVLMATEEAGEEVDDFEDFIYAKWQKITNVNGESVKYLGEELADRDADTLGYWHRRQVCFPSLGKMARALLAIPATSVSSKGAFSMGRLICRDKRAYLKGETTGMLMCMQD